MMKRLIVNREQHITIMEIFMHDFGHELSKISHELSKKINDKSWLINGNSC